MDIFDVVMRLNGPIDPVGDSGIDRTRLENLQALCDLTGQLFDSITAVAEAGGGHMASIKAAKDCAAKFITSTTGVAEVHAPLAELRGLIADDSYAMAFQTFGQYRTALLKAADKIASGVAIPLKPEGEQR
jgi:phage-related minor tail protein